LFQIAVIVMLLRVHVNNAANVLLLKQNDSHSLTTDWATLSASCQMNLQTNVVCGLLLL